MGSVQHGVSFLRYLVLLNKILIFRGHMNKNEQFWKGVQFNYLKKKISRYKLYT